MKRLLLLLFLLASAHARADCPTPRPVDMRPLWRLQLDLAAQYNSLGAYARFDASYQIPHRQKMGMVWSMTELGYRVSASPASTRFGVHAGVTPAAFFTTRIHYDLIAYHGVFGYLVTSDDKGMPHDEPDIVDRYFDSTPAIGQRIWLNPTLQAKVGAVAPRNQVDLTFYFVDTDHAWFFNWEYETMSRRTDFVLGERFSLLFNLLQRHPPRRFYVGPMYELAFQPSTAFRRQRVGLDWYVEPLCETRRAGLPRLTLITAFNLEERYRRHEFHVMLMVGTAWDLRNKQPVSMAAPQEH